MSKLKKKTQQDRRNKKSPPLSKQDKILYTYIQIFGALILVFFIYGYEVLSPVFIFKNAEVLAFEARWTVLLLVPLIFTWLIFILNFNHKKIPIIGNKKVDYFITDKYKSALPLFDKRYENIEIYKKGRKKALNKILIWFCIFTALLTIGVMGCIGRHEFNVNGIVTYSIFNNSLAEYSYDDVESYSVSADTYYVSRPRGLSYRLYDVTLVVNLSDGKVFSASYDMLRDLHALEKIDSLLKDKNKTVNSDHLQDFISRHEFSDDELKVLYNIFEEG